MKKTTSISTKNPIKLLSKTLAIVLFAVSSAATFGGPANASEEMTPVIYFDANVLAADLIHSENGQRIEQYQLALVPTPLSRVMTTKRDGYSFGGWSYKVGGEAAKTLETATYTATRLDLYAVWKTKINLNGNGATKGSVETVDYRFGQDLTLPGAGSLIRKGYSFGGWMATSAPGPIVTTYRAGVTENGNPIFYAAWNRTVTFKARGGTGIVPSPMIFRAGGDRLVLPSAASLSKTGYDFAGWATTPRGKAIRKSNAFLPRKSNTVLYALWKKN